MFRSIVLALAAAGFIAAGPLAATEKFIVVQSTTSIQNSGLYDHILPLFKEKTGIEVRVVAVGTGQAIRNAANGDGDVLLVHSKPSEEEFVAAGYGIARFDLMYNDFVIVGPAEDPAGVCRLWARATLSNPSLRVVGRLMGPRGRVRSAPATTAARTKGKSARWAETNLGHIVDVGGRPPGLVD